MVIVTHFVVRERQKLWILIDNGFKILYYSNTVQIECGKAYVHTAQCTHTTHSDNYSRSPSVIVVVLNASETQREYCSIAVAVSIRSRVSYYYFNVMRVILEEEAEREKIFHVYACTCVYRIWS